MTSYSYRVACIPSDLFRDLSNHPVLSQFTYSVDVWDKPGEELTTLRCSEDLDPIQKRMLDTLVGHHFSLVKGDSDTTKDSTLSDVEDVLTNIARSVGTLNYGLVTAEKTSTSSASILRVGDSNLGGRKVLEVINTGTVVIYVGSSSVTTSGATRGRPVRPNGSYALDVGETVDVYIISATDCTYVVTEGA